MKIAIKIFILLLAIILAVGGIMIYAKTKVEPPVALKQVNQFTIDLDKCNNIIVKEESTEGRDSTYDSAIDKIKVYQHENKIQASMADQSLDKLVDCYSPLFLQHCYNKFEQPVWSNHDNAHILARIYSMKWLKHSDKTMVLTLSTLGSLNQVSKIIADYKQALIVSQSSTFKGFANAKSTINQARIFAEDKYLSKCHNLFNALNSVKINIAKSHYKYILAKVEMLTEYRLNSQEYYEKSIVPQVDKAVTEYDNNATELYGYKENVDPLWERARIYYKESLKYYEN